MATRPPTASAAAPTTAAPPAASGLLSLNALLLTPGRVRWRALRELWLYRNYWRIPGPRAAMRRERDNELAETMPLMLLLAFMAAVLMFVVLPSSLGEQAPEALARLWPLWVVQVAPMLCALTMALLNAPSIALQLTERQNAGEFAGADPADVLTRSALAAHLCVPLVVAHAAVCTACTVLVVLFTLVFGLVAEMVLAVGDARAIAAVVFTQVPPLGWLHALFSAWALGLICVLAAVVYAWPGTQTTQRGLDAHRLGLRAMMVSAMACVGAGLAHNWAAALLGWGRVGP